MPKIERIRIGDKLVRPKGREPGANTLLYLPFSGNYNDSTGKSVSLAQGTAPSYGTTTSGEQYATISSLGLLSVDVTGLDLNNCTVSCWLNNTNSSGEVVFFMGGNFSGSGSVNGYGNGIILDANSKIIFFPYAADFSTNIQISKNAWHNVIYTVGSGTIKLYVDGASVYSTTKSFSKYSNICRLFKNPYTNNTADRYIGSFDEFIIEGVERTAQEITNYYNQTKGNYGL